MFILAISALATGFGAFKKIPPIEPVQLDRSKLEPNDGQTE